MQGLLANKNVYFSLQSDSRVDIFLLNFVFSAQEDTQVILTLTADLTLALLDHVPITPFVKTLLTQLYVSVLQPTLVILTSTADLTHVQSQLVVKILNVLLADNDHCADALEDLPEIQTVEQGVMLTLVQ